MRYKELDTNTLLDFIQDLDSVKEFFTSDELSVAEIGDGNLNYVYIVKSKQNPNKALIVKQAVEYLRCVGEQYPLSRQRMSFEIRALKKFYEYLPSNLPKIYYENEDMSLVIMQYLGEHEIMRKGLIQKTTYPKFSEHISTYLANILFYTSSLYLKSDKKRELIDEFNKNTQLCKLTEDFVFTTAYMEHETNDSENVNLNPHAKKLFADMEFKSKILHLKYKFMTQTDCLLHGDLHTGSIMLNQNETFVIDPEFAFVGAFGFDIGALIANLVNNYIHHSVVTKDDEFKDYILKTIKKVLELFEIKFLKLWNEQNESALLVDGFLDENSLNSFKSEFMKNILRDSIGFAGAKIARRVFGVAGVEDIRGIENKGLRQEAEVLALKIAREFVIKYENLNDINEVLEMIKYAR
ncbi:MAG: S-methyl-5-thioribose kinase [Sulfurimonas sp.]|nr:S-methyl-5-thioribose kinase [Sulfurimonas sp.]